MTTATKVKAALREKINPEKAAFYPKFFKTGAGEYGEGDKFLGVVVPDQRKIARQFKDLPRAQIEKLLIDAYHECRLTGIYILVGQFEKAKNEKDRKPIVDFYLANLDRVNNWDIVDASAHKILGAWLFDKTDRKVLNKLAKSKDLWRQRVAMIATYWFIKRDDFDDALALAEFYLDHEHDLMHKAVGWMLREIGKQDQNVLLAFLDQYAPNMPRTMLRYAIEKLPEKMRKAYLAQ